jgi:tRNA modification GTPase
LEAGCRSAQPGEFTQRAFLNGRMDLLQAEAVLDLIRASSDRAAALAVEQLEGALSARFHALYDEVLALASDLEASMDFSEDEIPPLANEEISRRLEQAIEESQALLQTWNEGRLVREGLKVSILGPPNAGKSTLFNALLGIDRAIVSDSPGTTRDTLEEGLILDGVPLRLIDTAGLRISSCAIEQEGIRRSIHFHKTSEVVVYMLDGTVEITHEDRDRILATPASRCILVVNKQDLGTRIPADAFPDRTLVQTSLKTAEGAVPVRDALRAWIQAALPADGGHHAAISERHRNLLLAGLEELHKARELLREQKTAAADLVAHHLRAMLEHLGLVTGRIYHEELLHSVFSRFCIGK